MQALTITNPASGRAVKVNAWGVNVRALLDKMTAAYRAGSPLSAKDISLMLLSDDQTIALAEAQESGDQASNNFALSVFEHTLDYDLGLAVLGYMRAVRAQHGRNPKSVTVAADRAGRVYIVTSKGVMLWSE